MTARKIVEVYHDTNEIIVMNLISGKITTGEALRQMDENLGSTLVRLIDKRKDA